MVTESDLRQFIGTEGYVRHISGVNMTDGVVYLREQGQCFWLIDYICFNNSLKGGEFQVIILKKTDDTKAVLTMREDTNTPILYKQEYKYTDIWKHVDMDEIKLYYHRGVLMLPSEY